MRNETRSVWDKSYKDFTKDYAIDDLSKGGDVSPRVEQRIVNTLGEVTDFLKEVNISPVNDISGNKLGFGVSKAIASRTNTDNDDRKTKFVGSLTPDGYKCEKTNSDIHIKYATVDSWAAMGKVKGVVNRYNSLVFKQRARDKLMIAWSGTHAAEDTDLEANPKLQDVNIGWPEKVRRNAPERMMGVDSEGKATEDTFKVGSGGDYETLDSVVFDVTNSLLDPWNQNSDDLVCIVGRELWVKHGLTMMNSNTAASERLALQTWFANELIGGLPTITVPYFPARGVVVTSYDNLSIYYQKGRTRLQIIDNPKRDRIEEYFSSNDAYVVEDYGKYGEVRDGAILLKNNKGEWV